MLEEVAMPTYEMAFADIKSGNDALVIRFVYAVSQLAELLVMEADHAEPVERAMPAPG